MERKNFSFFMPADFYEHLETVQSNDPVMASMSKSQAVHYIISKVAKAGIDVDELDNLKADEK